MITAALLMLSTAPTEMTFAKRDFECQFRRHNGTTLAISGSYSGSNMTSNLFEQIGDNRKLKSDGGFGSIIGGYGSIIHVNGHAWRRSWSVQEDMLLERLDDPNAQSSGPRRRATYPRYIVDIAEFPDGSGQILVGRTVHDGGRHTGEAFVGSGHCKIHVKAGEFNIP